MPKLPLRSFSCTDCVLIFMKIGDMVYDSGIEMSGIIIEKISSCVPWLILYYDGSIDIACDHDLEVISFGNLS